MSLPAVPEEWQQAPAREPALVVEPEPPPGWSSWEEVRSFRENLQKYRYALSTRRSNLTAEQSDALVQLFATPLGPPLKAAHEFAQSWYLVFRDDAGRPRSVSDARQNYETLRVSPAGKALAPVRRVQARMTDAHFDLLCTFLANDRWQATNNAAERMGRVFRHLQAPHYNLRSERAIEGALKVRALRGMQPPSPAARSSRGRKPTTQSTA